MSYQKVIASVWFLISLPVMRAAGQATGTAMSGPSPWIDVTAPPYSAICDGMTDDTAAIQRALNAVLQTGSALFIPPTANGCLIKGAYTAVTYAQTTGCTLTNGVYVCSATVTVTSISATNFPPASGVINIHNVALGSNGTNFNGTFQISSESGNCGHSMQPCITYSVTNATGANDTVSSPGPEAVAEVGLYSSGSNLKIIGAAEGSNNPGATSGAPPAGSMLSTTQPITILTTLTVLNPHTGPDIQNVTFWDSSGNGNAFAGLNIGNTNAFNVSNDGFYGFTAAGSGGAVVAADPQGGAGIVTTGGQMTSAISNPWVQFGKIENNHIQAKIGFTSKFNISSVTFDSNTVQCPSLNSPYPGAGMIGLDIGGLWYLNTSATVTGGENRVINQQSQGCLIGVLLGSQNNDVVEEKLENVSTATQCANPPSTQPPYCPIGMGVLKTHDSTFFAQSKYVASGIYIDKNSPNNRIYENTTGTSPAAGVTSGQTLNTLCPPLSSCPAASYTFNSGSLVIDPSDPWLRRGPRCSGRPPAAASLPRPTARLLPTMSLRA